jgi:DNA-directed RNA polymerase specialized sigma24 family protein
MLTHGEIPEADAASFRLLRPRLFGIACRVRDSAAEADDVVQDTWIRWQRTDRSQVRDPTGFLVTATTRLALTAGGSARARHETSFGPRLVEPVADGADPARDAEQREALELAVRTLLETLPATEGAIYVLREAFDYPYRQIAQLLAPERGERPTARRSRPPPPRSSSARAAPAGVGDDPVRREIDDRPRGVAQAVRQQRQVMTAVPAEVVDEQVRRRHDRDDEPEDERDRQQGHDDDDGQDRQRRAHQEPEEHDGRRLDAAERVGGGDACQRGVRLEPLGGRGR